MNMVEAINYELNRARELLKAYEGLPGNSGIFGAIFIRDAIREGESCIESLEVTDMLNAYEKLKRLE